MNNIDNLLDTKIQTIHHFESFLNRLSNLDSNLQTTLEYSDQIRENATKNEQVETPKTKKLKSSDKRRESSKKCERKRRAKMGESFGLLEKLLLGDSKDSTKRSKAEILKDAVDFIKSTKESYKLQNPSNFAQTFQIVDPELPFSPTIEELKTSFLVIKKLTWSKFSNIESKSQISECQSDFHSLEELAIRCNDPEISLHCYSTQSYFYANIYFQPQLLTQCTEKGLPLYFQLHKKNQQPVIHLGYDLGCVLMMHYAHCLATIGRFDKCLFYYEKAESLAKKLNHRPSLQIIYSNSFILKAIQGEIPTMEDAKRILEMSKEGPGKDFSLFMYYYTLCLHNININENIILMLKSMDDTISTYGILAEIKMRGLGLNALKSCDASKALNLIDNFLYKINKIGVNGGWSKSEVMRFKGEALLSQLSSVDNIYYRVEYNFIENLFIEAINSAIEEGFTVSQLNCTISLSKMYKETNSNKYIECVYTINQLHHKLAYSTTNETIPRELQVILKDIVL